MSVFGHLTFAAKSDVGRKRKNNEDAFGAFPKHGVWCVADGMGGGDDGEVASAAVIRSIETFCNGNPMPKVGVYSGVDVANGVVTAVNSASAWIYNRAKGKGLKGCGSTFVGVVFNAAKPDEATALHAGDSRLYRIRGKDIKQITRDHSAAEMIGAKNEAEVNPMFRGMILRAVGVQRSVEVDFTPLPLKTGDTVLICSDGLSRMVPDKQIAAIVREHGENVEKAAEALIAAANEAGGIDNVTAELIRVGELPKPSPTVAMKMTIAGTETSTESSLPGGGSTFDTAESGENAGTPIPSVTDATTDDTTPCGSEAKPSADGRVRKLSLLGGAIALVVLVAVVVALLPSGNGEQESLAEAEKAVAELQQKTLAEQQRLAAERDRMAEEKRLAEEKRQAEEARLAEEKRKAEETRKAEEARLAEEKRKAEAEAARVTHERQLAEMERRLQLEKLKEAEQRLEAEKKRLAAEEAEKRRLAEEAEKKRQAEEAERKRLAEEAEKKRQAEEAEKKRQTEEAEKKRAAEAASALAGIGDLAAYGGFINLLQHSIWDGKDYERTFEPLELSRKRLKGVSPADGAFAISVVDLVREVQKLAKKLALDLDFCIEYADDFHDGKSVLALERLKGLSLSLAEGDPANPDTQLNCVKWFEEGAKAPLKKNAPKNGRPAK